MIKAYYIVKREHVTGVTHENWGYCAGHQALDLDDDHSLVACTFADEGRQYLFEQQPNVEPMPHMLDSEPISKAHHDILKKHPHFASHVKPTHRTFDVVKHAAKIHIGLAPVVHA